MAMVVPSPPDHVRSLSLSIYLPSLTLNTTDPTLNFTLRLENPNKDKGIKYAPVNVTFYDFPNRSHVIGSGQIPGFYQGHKKKATKPGNTTASTAVALKAVSENGTGVFRVDLETAVKFKIMFWYTKKQRIRVGGEVMVNASGIKVDHKKIRLKSMASPKMGSFCVVLGALAPANISWAVET
ncbi:hypothetical protein CCACVL1_12896 [Corchorus capsularis]|uniref:Uncharacterized protein n=1 Tax=Corchorus capsularis TaxID=210143 RepID=A0A1R3ID96_COCAP|nr:hypothetical protein CCACVL1_12896 [Corchorus capsularis]